MGGSWRQGAPGGPGNEPWAPHSRDQELRQVRRGGQTLETEGAEQIRGGVALGDEQVQERLEQGGGVVGRRRGKVRTEGEAKGRAPRRVGPGENIGSVFELVAGPTRCLNMMFPFLLSQVFSQRPWLGEGGWLV